jgi:hypothetical protein
VLGHSRGTVVSSELAQRILWGGRANAALRPADLQITTLDPHDFIQPSLTQGEELSRLMANADRGNYISLIGSALNLTNVLDAKAIAGSLDFSALLAKIGLNNDTVKGSLASLVEGLLTKLQSAGKEVSDWTQIADAISLNPDLLGLKAIDFSDFYDPWVQAWAGVAYADNYYQRVADEKAAPGKTVTPNGRSLAGAQKEYEDNGFDFDFDLTGLKGFTIDDQLPVLGSKAETHSRPHTWYAGTLNSQFSYFSTTQIKFKGDEKKDAAGNRTWIIRRAADRAYERNPMSVGGG